MKNFKKFPSIENFVSLHHSIKKNIFVNERPIMNYRGKVKLHGTNAGVTIRKKEENDKAAFYTDELAITPLKRSSFISPQDDNAGFATWVGERVNFFSNIFNMFTYADDVTVFGEWAGKGIQKSDAVSKIDGKHFFIFSIRVDDKWITDPADILFYTGILSESHVYGDIHVLPWYTEELKVDFSSSIDVDKFVENVNNLTGPLNQIDPYIKYTFGIEDHGEGFVFYPIIDNNRTMTEEQFNFVFKAKVEAHNASGNKNKAAEADPILHDNAAKFADEFVTDARVKQALCEVYPERAFDDFTQKDTGPILAWICRDVHKESVAALEVSGMEWNQVAKAVTEKAKQMYFKMLETL